MKKLAFLLGTLGGALAGYVFSNNKLRKELKGAKDASEAAQILGRHLARDGQSVAKEVGNLADEYHLDDHLEEGKKYVKSYYRSAKDEVQKFLGAKVKQASRTAAKARKKVLKKVRVR